MKFLSVPKGCEYSDVNERLQWAEGEPSEKTQKEIDNGKYGTVAALIEAGILIERGKE